jgi:hypothetical protein
MSRAPIICGQCRLARSEQQWSLLPPVTEVAAGDLEGLVIRWPDQLVVIVRACTCGGTIARLASRARDGRGL